MRKKIAISTQAMSMDRHFGRRKALEFGFNEHEFSELWWFALFPHFVVNIATHADALFNDSRRAALLQIISQRPEKALKIIALIRNHNESRGTNIIRKTLLDPESSPPNWTLPDKVIANLVCKKINQPKKSGKALQDLIENIKKQRQALAKQYPITKGKKEAA